MQNSVYLSKFYENEPQVQKVMLVSCDPSCLLQMLKDGCQKITATENKCMIAIIWTRYSSTVHV